MAKKTFYVKGMHCASCEVLIEKELLLITGIVFADASLPQGLVSIEYDKERPDLEELNAKFKPLGYSFSEEAFKEKDGGWKTLLVALSAIAVFLVISQSGLSSLINVSSESSLAAFFVFGLIAGISSCAALIGGLVLSLSKKWLEDFGKSDNFTEKAKPHLLFNFGRLISLPLLGSALGSFGEKIKMSPAIASIMVLIVSGAMIVLALQMIGVKSFRRIRIALPKSFSGRLFRNQKSKLFEPFTVGFLTFLLPCGFTAVVEGFAILSGSSLKGFLIMLFFTLGTTVPLLFIGFSSAKLLSKEHLSERFLKIAGVLILFFTIYNIDFQFGIGRFLSEKWFPGDNVFNEPIGPVAANVQIIKAVYEGARDIRPNSFEVKAGQPVRFEVEVRTASYGCMSTIVVPGLWNRPLALQKGQTLVMEFIPQKPGVYQIACAMGVPRGTIKVVK